MVEVKAVCTFLVDVNKKDLAIMLAKGEFDDLINDDVLSSENLEFTARIMEPGESLGSDHYFSISK